MPRMNTAFAVDSHAHVFDPVRFPLSNTGTYVPLPKELGTPAQFRTVLDVHGITHALLVNPLPGYGNDNRCMLDAIASSNGRFKGVARIGHDVTDDELRTLDVGGVIGARFSISAHSTSLQDPAGKALLARIKALGWFAQIYYQGDGILDLLPALRESGIRIVVDHCGCPDPARGLAQPGFEALLELGRTGMAAVKLSGAFRYSRQRWPYADCEPYIAALVDAFTLDNGVWGSDWPFVRVDMRMDYGPELALLERWIPDPAERHKVMWETPRRWFGFAPN